MLPPAVTTGPRSSRADLRAHIPSLPLVVAEVITLVSVLPPGISPSPRPSAPSQVLHGTLEPGFLVCIFSGRPRLIELPSRLVQQLRQRVARVLVAAVRSEVADQLISADPPISRYRKHRRKSKPPPRRRPERASAVVPVQGHAAKRRQSEHARGTDGKKTPGGERDDPQNLLYFGGRKGRWRIPSSPSCLQEGILP